MKKQLTKKEWGEFVLKNCDNSYSLAVCLAIINLWEKPTDDLHGYGLTGAQTEMAIDFVKNYDLAVTNLQSNPLMEEREDLLPSKDSD